MATSLSGQKLESLLRRDGALAADVRAAFGRTHLYRLTTGKRLPELRTAVKLEQITRGIVTCGGWLLPPKAGRIVVGRRIEEI